MFQFLKDVYNYFFKSENTISLTQNSVTVQHTDKNQITLYKIMTTKHMQKYNNRYSQYNKYIYKDNISVYTFDNKHSNDIDFILKKLSMLSHDIICITNITNSLQSYYDGLNHRVIYIATFIASIMDMYYIVGSNCIFLSRLPIHNTKSYIIDELYGNYIYRITVHVNEKNINIYTVNINPSVISYLNYTNTFIANLLDDNYNKIPYIITGIANNTLYNWIMSSNTISNTSNYKASINSLLPLNNKYTSTYFVYVNSYWCNQFACIDTIIYDTQYSINTLIKLTT